MRHQQNGLNSPCRRVNDTENRIPMSKTVKTERSINTERFIDLLTKAQGNRTRTQFAKDCGISLPHLSKLINNRIEKPPIPSTLKKLADHAANGVTYEELLDAVGYNVEAYAKTSARKLLSPNLKLTPEEIKQIGFAVITAALAKSPYSWSVDGQTAENFYDLRIDLKDEQHPSRWSFQFLTEMPTPHPERARIERLYAYYAHLAIAPSGYKILHSFVTSSPELFDLMVKNPPLALAMYISVILIDPTTLSIVKTVQLKTSFPEDPTLPTLT